MPLMRARIAALLLGMFCFSVLVRRPLYNGEFTASWEWLSAHTLLTCQLWDSVPASIHHFNLLYTFARPEDKFIDDLWQSGVADKLGNYYYVSMPHLAFLTPYLFLKLSASPLTTQALQTFALLLHLFVGLLLYVLAMQVTCSRWAAVSAFTMMLFAPTALFFYQNAMVGTLLVIPYTIAVLISTDRLLRTHPINRSRKTAWITLLLALFLGCMTDWQAYFTAFATAVVAIVIAIRIRDRRSTAVAVIVACTICVVTAVSVIVYLDSQINGFKPFVQTIYGRFKVRSGSSSQGLGLSTFDYYRNLLRFYSAYLPYVALSLALLWIANRRAHAGLRVHLRNAWVTFAISFLALITDHLILAHHTSQQSFTTLNSLVPFGLLLGVSVVGFLEHSSNVRRDRIGVSVALGLCVAVSLGGYRFAYFHRAKPFDTAASAMSREAQANDVMFATGDGFSMPSDYMIPQVLFYLRRNVQVVRSEHEAAQYLACREQARGILAHVTKEYVVTRVESVKRASVCAEVSRAFGG